MNLSEGLNKLEQTLFNKTFLLFVSFVLEIKDFHKDITVYRIFEKSGGN